MRRLALMGLVSLVVAGCTSSDDAPVTEAADSATDSIVIDSTTPDTSAPDTTPAADTAVPPADTIVSEAQADSAADTVVADAAVVDTAVVDSAVTDTAVADTAVADTAVADTAVADTKVADTKVADTAVADTAIADTPAGTANCGAAPYAALELGALLAVTGGPTTPVTISANICPATTVVVATDEKKSMNVTKGVPFFLTGTQTGSHPSFGPEYNLPAALTSKLPAGVIMWMTGVPTALANPAWDPATMGFLRLGSPQVKSGATAPCNTVDGITYAVTGHTEAVIKYEDGGTSTSVKGTAWATIVTTGTSAASPEFTTITATKASCKLGPTPVGALILTGRVPFARNTASIHGGFELSN